MDRAKLFKIATRLIPAWFIFWIIASLIKYPYFFANFLANGIARGAIYALIAFGFGLIYNVTGVLNLAHGEVFMIGAVTSTTIFIKVLHATEPNLRNWIWFFVILMFSMALGAFVSLLVEKLVFKRLRQANKIAPIIASLGIALILQNLGIFINGSGKHKFNTIFPQFPGFIDLATALQRAAIVLVFAVPFLWLFAYLTTRSKNGLAIEAVAQNPDQAKLVGIDINKTIARTFVFAGAAAGLAGILYAQTYRMTNYSLGMEIGLISYAAAVIGGISSIRGTIFGGFLVGIIVSLSDGLPSGLGYRWSETAIYSIFILMLVYKPQGLLGYEKENV